MYLNLDPVRGEAHDACRLHPWNLLKLFLAFIEGNVEDVAADVPAHHFHHLGTRHIADPGHFDVVARLQPETPGVFSIMVERSRGDGTKRSNNNRYDCPQQPCSSFLWERAPAC